MVQIRREETPRRWATSPRPIRRGSMVGEVETEVGPAAGGSWLLFICEVGFVASKSQPAAGEGIG